LRKNEKILKKRGMKEEMHQVDQFTKINLSDDEKVKSDMEISKGDSDSDGSDGF